MYNYLRVAYHVTSLSRHTHWSRRQLSDYQNKQVREIVRYAYDHVPFYHKKLSRLELRPEDIRTVEDLNKLPIVERDELQKNSEELISDGFDANRLFVASTSGSTGRPFFTYLSKKEREFRHAKLLRPHIVCGQKPWDKWVIIGPPHSNRKLAKLQKILGIYAPIFVSVFEHASKQLSAIEQLKPKVLDGYSSSLFLLAREAEKKGAINVRPSFLMGGGELIDDADRRFLENIFAAPYYDQYASEEFQMLAWQCPAKNEYHVDADSVILQFVDGDGSEVASGEKGEIVCTSLFNYAMPIIRYAVGDVGVPSEEKECDCGITFPLMKLIEGRKESMVVLPDGRSLSPLAIGDCMCAFRFFTYIYQYRFIQKGENVFEVLIRKKDGAIDDYLIAADLLKHIKETLGINESEVAVTVEVVDEIPPDKVGKIRKVISELRDVK